MTDNLFVMKRHIITPLLIVLCACLAIPFVECLSCGVGQCTNNTLCCPGERQCCNDLDLCCGEHCCRNGYECCHGSPRCCKSSSKCCGDSLCCPDNANCCPNQKHCCPAGFTCCDKTGGCCPENHQCCGPYCCEAGSYCCPNGTGCFKDGYKCCGNGVSCPVGFLCCGLGCCSPRFKCCGTQCCKDDIDCCGDKCCPGGIPNQNGTAATTQGVNRYSSFSTATLPKFVDTTSSWSIKSPTPDTRSPEQKGKINWTVYSSWGYFLLIPFGFLVVFVIMIICCILDKHKPAVEKLKTVVLQRLRGKPTVQIIDKF